jgi:uncharacterized integral membrane protein
MRNFKLITASVLAILVAIVVVQNRQRVATHLLFATVVMPHAILLFIASAAGIRACVDRRHLRVSTDQAIDAHPAFSRKSIDWTRKAAQ